MNLVDLFDLTLKDSAGAPALEYDGITWSFGELELESNRLAHHLQEAGHMASERLVVFLPNCVELVIAYLAAMKLGLIFTPINALYRQWEIGHILADAEPSVILTNRGLSGYLPIGWKFTLAEDLRDRIEDQPEERPKCPAAGESPAVLVYTSGTTGRPKGALLTHNNLAMNALTLNTCWRLAREDRMLMALPLFHINGIANGLNTWLSVGFRMRLLERFRKDTILNEFLDFRPTFFFGVPTMYTRMLDASAEAGRRIGEQMRLFVSGSAPLPPQTMKQYHELFGHSILERYGMTETLGITANPYAGERRPGTVGKVLPGISVRLSEGERGEVLVKGPTVFAGYWKNEEATRAAFTPDGYFRTGDMAERSADRYYTLRGRLNDLIISGGFNIYPQEIEDLLLQQGGISEAVVVAEPDPIRGERPVAYLVANPGIRIDTQSLRMACQENLASYKVPRDFRFVADVPRNALGKIQRHRLRTMAGSK